MVKVSGLTASVREKSPSRLAIGIPNSSAISIERASDSARDPRSYEPMTTALMEPDERVSTSWSVQPRALRKVRIRRATDALVGWLNGALFVIGQG
jgi:hypothetical protein